MTTAITRSTHALVLIGCLLVFTPMVHFSPTKQFFEILNSLACAASMGVMIGFGRSYWYSGMKRPTDLMGRDVLLQGIFYIALGLFISFFMLWLWRINDKPPGLEDHWVVAWGRGFLILGGLFCLTAVNAIDGSIPRRSWLITGAWIGAGLAAMFLSFTLGYGW